MQPSQPQRADAIAVRARQVIFFVLVGFAVFSISIRAKQAQHVLRAASHSTMASKVDAPIPTVAEAEPALQVIAYISLHLRAIDRLDDGRARVLMLPSRLLWHSAFAHYRPPPSSVA